MGPNRWKAYSVQLPGKLSFSSSNKISRRFIQEMRKQLILMRKANLMNLKSKNFYWIYEKKMNKMVNFITTILYHHILHSHTYISEPSEGALLFSEKHYIEVEKKLHTTTDIGIITTFPVFQFTVEKETLPEDEREYDFDVNRNEISKMITYIFDELHLAHEWVLIAFIYLERLMTKAQVEIRTSNWRPLLLTSIILAAKYWEDWGFWNYDFAQISQYSLYSINKMESLMLGLLEYDLFVSSTLYKQYFKQIAKLHDKIKKEERIIQKKDDYRRFGFVKSNKHRKSDLIPRV